MAEPGRLDQLSKTVLDQAFALATQGFALPEGAELCIRKLSVPISLRVSASDVVLARDWSVAMAQEISRTAREGSSANVVFYHSRRQALIDLALGVARDDLSRIWAWRQLGLWRSNDPTNGQANGQALVELTRTLCVEAAAVVPTLRVLANAGWLGSIARRLTEDQWEKLAFAALSEAGVQLLPGEALRVPSSRAVRDALRVLNASLLVQAVAFFGSSIVNSGEACRAVAALAVLDVEPILLHTAAAQTIVAIIADAIQTRSSTRIQALPQSSEPRVSNPAEWEREGECENLNAELKSDDETNSPLDLRQRGFTRFGGLLFLLHVIEDLKLPEEILAGEHLGARPFVWVIHQLALTLADTEPNDPAALGFAGLPPNATPPSQGQEPVSKDEAHALNNLAERITNRLRTLLESEKQPDRALLEFVCGRRAEIVADPGWIEAKLSLDDVSTAIRRAGLDVDPDYVPWLGVVLRFVYE